MCSSVTRLEEVRKWETHREDGALAGVQQTQSLVFAGGEDPGSVAVPAGAVDHVRVHIDPHHRLPTGHVPKDDDVVTACKVNEKKPSSESPVWRLDAFFLLPL